MANVVNKSFRNLSPYLSPRYVLGLFLILSSFFSAYLISKASDRTINVWSSTVDLAPGEVITNGDISPVRVRLPENAAQYLDARTDLVGTSVLRSIGAAELIPSFAISAQQDLNLRKVPISIARDLAPVDLANGATVDIYGVPAQNNQLLTKDSQKAKLILSGVSVDAVDESARELGGRIGLTVLIPETDVFSLISSIGNFEFMLVLRSPLS